MALQKAVSKIILGENLNFPDAYHEVTAVSGNKLVVTAEVTIFKDASKEIIIDKKVYTITPTLGEGAKDLFAQVYKYIKIQPDYENALDC